MASSKEDTKSQADESPGGEQHQHQLKGEGSAQSASSPEGGEQHMEGEASAQSETFVVQDGLPVDFTPSDPVIDSADFEELVRELCHKINPDIRIESTALAAMHDFSEVLLDGLFEVCAKAKPHDEFRFVSDSYFNLIKRMMNVVALASAAD
ncbi:hypothetical protein W97_05965 [Coniosporium apollinis CBS 100218]|uniref:Uncharacterized protein n=1 Tax=Coniosporium apollinis (strain CBS 100218) TaxID=1168221 RepID=R7YY58_CONA1|nr:uncharacterized protein W97_05965 [Coniosporium apollinis CBS 100218]EON66719.1 hypothetical protein W97_05965 [Coniosporium apollinis CBS 100218]